MIKKYDAVIAGYTCVDLIPGFIQNESYTSIYDFLKPGQLTEIGEMNFILGGAVPNTGLAMKKFNKKVFLNGLIGDDFIGGFAKQTLEKYNIGEGIQTTKSAGTAFSIVIAPPGVDRIFLESPGCNTILDSSYIDFKAIAQSRLFHFGYPPLLRQFFLNGGVQLSNLYSKIQQLGVITSLDFSLPDPESESGKIYWPDIMKKTLPFIDIFVPSLEEVLKIMMPEKYAEMSASGDNSIFDEIPISAIREVGKLIIDSGVKILLLKTGKRGAYLMTGDISSVNRKLDNILNDKEWSYKELWCNAYHADESRIVNTNGAGDTAAAAFLSAVLDGVSPEYALKYAAVAGRNNLYCHNIYTDLSDWHMMTEEIKSETNEIIIF